VNGLVIQFPHKEEEIKEIGRIIANEYEVPLADIDEITEDFKKTGKHGLKLIFNLLEEFNAYNELLDESSVLSSVKIIKKNTIFIIRYSNFSFLQNKQAYEYHMIIVTGYIEQMLINRFGIPIKCNLEMIHLSDRPENTFIDVLIEFMTS